MSTKTDTTHSLAWASPASWGLGRISCCILLVTLVFAPNSSAETSLTTLRRQTSELLRQEAIAKTRIKKDDAIVALCDMYVLIRKDDRYGSSEMLQQDASKIRRRLLKVAKQRQAQLERDNVPRSSSLTSEVDSAISDALNSSAEDQGRLREAAFAGGGFDNGWQLVELIQRIVAPDFWDTAGGPGSIHYFAMRRVLVVRATSDVHEQIKDLLLSLPR